jgi:hypothetical protein
MGSVGEDVRALQAALNCSAQTLPPLLVPDGIFGGKTLTKVKAFQTARKLAADGIVGPLTWAALHDRQQPHRRRHINCACGNTNHAVGAQLRQELAHYLAGPGKASFGQPQAFSARAGTPMKLGITAPKLRTMTDPEKAIIDSVYGNSIDYSTVFLSNKTGFDDRAFVLAVPASNGMGRTIQIVNIGESYTRHTLVHEFGHVWESQHHGNPTQYMANAVASQAAAGTANLVMRTDTYDAYAYVKGRPFSSYGAEQIAEMVADGVQDIIDHVRSIAKGAVDPELKLTIPRFENRALPDVH